MGREGRRRALFIFCLPECSEGRPYPNKEGGEMGTMLGSGTQDELTKLDGVRSQESLGRPTLPNTEAV